MHFKKFLLFLKQLCLCSLSPVRIRCFVFLSRNEQMNVKLRKEHVLAF